MVSLIRPPRARHRLGRARHRRHSRSAGDVIGLVFAALYLLLALGGLALINVAVLG
jgi:hypothetical protein